MALPRLAAIREEDGPAWLAHGDDGGWLATLKDATPGSLKPNTFWGNVSATLPVVMIGTDYLICVQETTAFMDGTTLSVGGEPGKRRAALGTTKSHRVNGTLCYDMNTGPGTPRNCGNQQTPNLLIEQESSCRLDFLSAPDDKTPLTWLDGAKLVRKRMPLRRAQLPQAFVHLRAVRATHPSDRGTDRLLAADRPSLGLAISGQRHRLSRGTAGQPAHRRLRRNDESDAKGKCL